MSSIVYIDRLTGKREKEVVFGQHALRLLYGDDWKSAICGSFLATLVSRFAFFSKLYGWLQRRPSSRRKIAAFIRDHAVNTAEFVEKVENFRSFNEFFCRHLKSEARPITPGEEVAIIPADGRYLVYEDIEQADGFVVKGQKFKLEALLDDAKLAAEYQQGGMVIARLCPSDCHRFVFPIDCQAGITKEVDGDLFSVNPLAIRKNLHIFSRNRRTVCHMESRYFGKVLFLEIGATCVGTIHQTYRCGPCHKGSEKGYFSFGGSSIILLFPPKAIQFDRDLIKATEQGLEMKCLIGQSLGKRVLF